MGSCILERYCVNLCQTASNGIRRTHMTTDKQMSPTCSSFRSKAFVLFLMNVLASGGVFAATAQWIIDTSSTAAETTFDGAAAWFNGNNWEDGAIASAAGDIAMFWPSGGNWHSGLRYTSLDRNVTLRSIVRNFQNTQTLGVWDANKRVILGGDNVITLDSGGSGVSMMGLRVYASTCINASSSLPELTLVDVCDLYALFFALAVANPNLVTFLDFLATLGEIVFEFLVKGKFLFDKFS